MNATKRIQGSAACAARAPSLKAAGFTLVDLVVVVVIVAVMISIAAPSFAAFIASQRASTAAMDLYAALTLARSEATKRNANVTLAPATGGWQNGWSVADPAISGRSVLEHGLLANATLTGPGEVVYQRSGRVRGTAPTFTLTVSTGESMARRCVLTDLSGRPYIQSC